MLEIDELINVIYNFLAGKITLLLDAWHVQDIPR